MNTLTIILLTIVGIIAIFYILLVGGSFRMRGTATAFLEAIREERYVDAHSHLHPGFAQTVSADNFESFLCERGVFLIKEVKRYMGDYTISSRAGSVKPFLIRADNVYFPMNIGLAYEDGKWSVVSLDVQLRLAPAAVPIETIVNSAMDEAPKESRISKTLH